MITREEAAAKGGDSTAHTLRPKAPPKAALTMPKSATKTPPKPATKPDTGKAHPNPAVKKPGD